MKIHDFTSRRGTEGEQPAGRATPGPDDVLESWKEIAGFVRRNERTAMRWAKELGMPVHRGPGEKRGRVYALRSEVSDWLRTAFPEMAVEAVNKTSHRLKFLAIAGVAVVLIVCLVSIVVVTQRKPRLPARVHFTATGVQALDDEGRALWVHEFGRPILSHPFGESKKVEELARIFDSSNGDRTLVVATPFRLEPNPPDVGQFEIDCFSSRGKLLWSYIPREVVRFGDHELSGPWYPMDLFISRLGDRPSVRVAFSHQIWGNSYVAELDVRTGHPTIRYVNTGTIRALNQVRVSRATYLLAGGFNNEYDGGSLALIDESKAFAVSPQTKGTRHKCVSCGGGVPDYYFVFPRSELNQLRKNQNYEDPVRGIRANGDELQISEHELPAQYPAMRTIYLFRMNPTVHPIERRFSSDYDMLHRELERSQELHHTLETCPERLNPAVVKMWTPAGGWEELKLKPAGVAQ